MNQNRHEIRLAGPWEYAASGTEDWQRTTLPFQQTEPDSAGALRRKFHRPGGLVETSKVQLAVSASRVPATLLINDTSVPPVMVEHPEPSLTTTLFDVTQVLGDFNTLHISLLPEAGASPVTIIDVRLRILEQTTSHKP
ncbi:MAG: hypothetical protein RIK87_15315 [Fuerstiella sp.]